MEANDIGTPKELANYISLYKDSIYVREQVDGEWGAYSLTELPANLAIDHALRFIQEQRIPARIREVTND